MMYSMQENCAGQTQWTKENAVQFGRIKHIIFSIMAFWNRKNAIWEVLSLNVDHGGINLLLWRRSWMWWTNCRVNHIGGGDELSSHTLYCLIWIIDWFTAWLSVHSSMWRGQVLVQVETLLLQCLWNFVISATFGVQQFRCWLCHACRHSTSERLHINRMLTMPIFQVTQWPATGCGMHVA